MFFAFYQQTDFKDLFFDFNNPVYYSILATIFVLIIIYFFFYYVISPLNKKHILEKKELELKQIKLMALFADLDPDPVLRIDETGNIIFTNNAAKLFPEFSVLEGTNIKNFLNQLDIDFKDIIESNSFQAYSTYINNKFYMISVRGNSFLNIAQIYFNDITERKKFENRLKLSRRKLKSLSHHLIDLIEEERQRMARELHDGVGQNLLFLKLKIQNIANNSNDTLFNEEYSSLLNLFEGTIKDLRNVIYGLKPKMLEEMGLSTALVSLCDSVSTESKIEGKIDVLGLKRRIGFRYEITIYRIIQECLNNIIKHSQAKNFNVQLIEANNKIRILISDDGIGFNPELLNGKNNDPRSGYGLLNIRERILNLKGVFKIDSNSSGSLVIAEIPLEETNEK